MQRDGQRNLGAVVTLQTYSLLVFFQSPFEKSHKAIKEHHARVRGKRDFTIQQIAWEIAGYPAHFEDFLETLTANAISGARHRLCKCRVNDHFRSTEQCL